MPFWRYFPNFCFHCYYFCLYYYCYYLHYYYCSICYSMAMMLTMLLEILFGLVVYMIHNPSKKTAYSLYWISFRLVATRINWNLNFIWKWTGYLRNDSDKWPHTNVNTSNASVAVALCFDGRPRILPFTGTAVIPLPFVMIFILVGGGSDEFFNLCDFLLLFIALDTFVQIRFLIAHIFVCRWFASFHLTIFCDGKKLCFLQFNYYLF